jgi:hypothetical protein
MKMARIKKYGLAFVRAISPYIWTINHSFVKFPVSSISSIAELVTEYKVGVKGCCLLKKVTDCLVWYHVGVGITSWNRKLRSDLLSTTEMEATKKGFHRTIILQYVLEVLQYYVVLIIIFTAVFGILRSVTS